MNSKWIQRSLAVLLCASLALTAAGCAGPTDSSTPTNTDASTQTGGSAVVTQPQLTVTENDTDASWSEADANAIITFSGNTIAVSGSGAKASESVLTISSGGLYLLSGSLDDGQVIIQAPATDTVRLVLNGVHLTSASGSASTPPRPISSF